MAGWTSVEEIDAYRLSVALRDRITRLTEAGPISGDAAFRDQIRRSSSSVTANLAEGFERYFHGEFAHLAGVAKGSLGETIDHVKNGHQRGYFSDETRDELLEIAEKARKATTGLVVWLRRSKAPGETRRKRT